MRIEPTFKTAISAFKAWGTVLHVLIPKQGSTKKLHINSGTIRGGLFWALLIFMIYESKMMGTTRMPPPLPSSAGDQATSLPPRIRGGPFALNEIEVVLLSWRQHTLFRDKTSTKTRVFLPRWVGWLWLWSMPPRPLMSFARGTSLETTSAGGAMLVFNLVFICCLPNFPTV